MQVGPAEGDYRAPGLRCAVHPKARESFVGLPRIPSRVVGGGSWYRVVRSQMDIEMRDGDEDVDGAVSARPTGLNCCRLG